jgi:hypothetical protein
MQQQTFIHIDCQKYAMTNAFRPSPLSPSSNASHLAKRKQNHLDNLVYTWRWLSSGLLRSVVYQTSRRHKNLKSHLVYTCVCDRMYTFLCVCVRAELDANNRMIFHKYTFTFSDRLPCIHSYTHSILTYIHTHTHTYMHTYIHTHTHTCAHTHTQ